MEYKIEEVLKGLRYPMPEADICNAFKSLYQRAQSQPEAFECVFNACSKALKVNIAYVHSKMQEEVLFRPASKPLTTHITWETLLELRYRSQSELVKQANKYLELTPDNLSALHIDQLAEEQVRMSLPSLIAPGDTLAGLMTQKAVQEVFQLCSELFTDKTQMNVLGLGDELQLIIESYYRGFVDLTAFSALQRKFVRKLARLRLQHLLAELQQIFQEEASTCTTGQPMDRGVDPQSLKMRELRHIAAIACSVQPDGSLPGACLSRVMSGQPELSAESVPGRVRMEALCRFYIGCVNLAGDLCTDAELLLWLKRVLRALYQYPREESVYENQFLNVLNRSAAVYLRDHRTFRYNLRYALDQGTHSLSWPGADLTWAFESLTLRSLSCDPSLSCILHVPSPGEKWEIWTGTEHWDVDRIALQWKKAESNKQAVVKSKCMLKIPLVLFSCPYMLAPILLQGFIEFIRSTREDSEATLKQAQDIGVYLGLLLTHRKLYKRFVSLIGHCVGAKTVLACLAEIAEYNRCTDARNRIFVLDVILMVGAVDALDVDWMLVKEPVKGRFINIFSSREEVVSRQYGKLMTRPIGYSGVGVEGIQDVDVADVLHSIANHKDADAGYQLRKLLKLIDFHP